MTCIGTIHDMLSAQLRGLDPGLPVSTLRPALDAARTNLVAACAHLEKKNVEPADVDDARAVAADARALLRRFDFARKQNSLPARPVLLAARQLRDTTNDLERTISRVDAELTAWARSAAHRPTESDFGVGWLA